ncbi:hypothetical protein OC835_006653 [Tilletia horrida]|uniref:Uncharacterized protein n=1 Tax=Tilletia horrida TaxID=155126 RepID=A0AAN6G5Q8_9BASI|nr:hypothetical protein OC842_007694 [Tilletia horrida]KAK0522203.1 hypothetical protein OC835_006653 [Tilletia horrida]
MNDEEQHPSTFAASLVSDIAEAHVRGDWWAVLGLNCFTYEQQKIQQHFVALVHPLLRINKRIVYLQRERDFLDSTTYESSWALDELDAALNQLRGAKENIDELIKAYRNALPSHTGGGSTGTANGGIVGGGGGGADKAEAHTVIKLLKSAIALLEGRHSAAVNTITNTISTLTVDG